MGNTKFYASSYKYLSIALVFIFVGFANSYFGRFEELSFSYHLHFFSAFLWMVTLILQPYFYSKGKMKTHRFLGWFSMILVPLLIGAGIVMIGAMIHRQAQYPPNAVYQLSFVDVLTLFGFVLLYYLAIFLRKNTKLHARLMIMTVFGPLVPAITRVYFVVGLANSFTVGLNYSYLLIEFVLLLIIWRERSKKEMQITYLPYLVFIIIQHVLIYFTGTWEWWIATMNNLSGYTS